MKHTYFARLVDTECPTEPTHLMSIDAESEEEALEIYKRKLEGKGVSMEHKLPQICTPSAMFTPWGREP